MCPAARCISIARRTYTPLSGDKFARSLLQPLPPSEVFELIQAGYPADAVLLIITRAINGIYNRSGIGPRARESDPEFYPLLDALRRLQLSGAVSIRLEKRGSEQLGMLILSGKRAAEANQDLQFVRKTLEVTPDRNGEVTVVFGLLPRGPNEIALLTRSMAEILLEVSAGIEVPPEHVAQGRTATATRLAGAENPRQLCRRPLSRHLVLDRRRRPDLEARFHIPDDILLARRNRRHTAGAGADNPGQLSRI